MIQEDIVSDHDLVRAHANARFGSRSKRSVVNTTVFSAAFGFTSGSTALAICHELGLIRKTRQSDRIRLTSKGYSYLRAIVGPYAWARMHDKLSNDQPIV